MSDTPMTTTADKVAPPAVGAPVSAPKIPADGVKAAGDSKIVSEPPGPGSSESKSQTAPAPLKT